MKTISMKTIKAKALKPKALKLTPPEPREATVLKEIFAVARMKGWLVIRFNSGAFPIEDGEHKRRWFTAYRILNCGQSKGLPDLLLFKSINGVTAAAFIEVKRPGGAVRTSQAQFAAYAETQFEIPVYVVDDRDEAGRILDAVEASVIGAGQESNL